MKQLNLDSLENFSNNLVLYGAGMIGRITKNYLDSKNIKVNYFCDSDDRLSGKIVDGIVKRMDIWKIDSWVTEMNEYGMNLELFINDLVVFKNNARNDFFQKTKVFGLNNSSKDYFFDETALNIYEIYEPFITEYQNNY